MREIRIIQYKDNPWKRAEAIQTSMYNLVFLFFNLNFSTRHSVVAVNPCENKLKC